MAAVNLKGVFKSFGSTRVVHGVDIRIEDGEFCVLVGPSGCGKSTLLRMIAGLEEISGGEIEIGGRVVNKVPPKERDIAMVFQNYALYPHMTVFDNMAFSMKLAGESRKKMRERVEVAANILGLMEYLERYPRQLSGGQRQRVAMGRAIVRDPQVFLFDEPLSNLDAKLRVQLFDLGAHLHPEFCVQVGQRLVEQEHLRVAHDGAAHGYALALAARELARVALKVLHQSQNVSRHLDALAHFLAALAGELHREGHVVEHGHVRVERVVLEHHGDVALLRRHLVDHAPADLDLAARYLLQAGDHAQQRGLAAARRADQHAELSVLDPDIHAVHDAGGAEGLEYAFQGYCRHD